MINHNLVIFHIISENKVTAAAETLRKYRLTHLWRIWAGDTVYGCIRMPVVADARHLVNGKRLSDATKRGIGAVAVTFPPDVERRRDVGTTDRCIHSRTQSSSIILDVTIL